MHGGQRFDAAEKRPLAPSAPSFDSPRDSAPHPYAFQPQREPSASALYAQPVPSSYQHGGGAPHPPMPPMPPMAPLVPQHSAHFQQHKPIHPHEYYDAEHSDDESAVQTFLFDTGRLALFHALNGVLGYVAFTVCVGGVATSVGLLPLCCFGIVIFRIVLYAVYGLAQLDVMLYNFIAPPEDHVFVSVPRNPRAMHLSGQRLAPSLSSFSPLSLMALIYFCSVKFALSTLSTIVFSIATTAPLSLLCAVLGTGHGAFFQIVLGPEDVVDFNSDPLLFIVVAVCLFAVGVALMHVVARLSREATIFFCCERFSTYRYVHNTGITTVGADQHQQLYYPLASAAPAYGAFSDSHPPPPAATVVSYHGGGV